MSAQQEFATQLRDVAAELKPLAEAIIPGATFWDGMKYTRYTETTPKVPDPYALSWWSLLNAIAEMIEGQESILSSKQIAYLERLLFGGMGSLNDLWFDSKAIGAVANDINVSLDQKRRVLFETFESLRSR